MSFLNHALKDDKHGGFFWGVSHTNADAQEGGHAWRPVSDRKYLTGLAAVLMAASEVSAVAPADSPEAAEAAATADEAFKLMMRHHRDDANKDKSKDGVGVGGGDGEGPGGGFWPEVTRRDWTLEPSVGSAEDTTISAADDDKTADAEAPAAAPSASLGQEEEKEDKNDDGSTDATNQEADDAAAVAAAAAAEAAVEAASEDQPRTLSAHLLCLEALTSYVDSFIARGVIGGGGEKREMAKAAAAATTLSEITRTLVQRVLQSTNQNQTAVAASGVAVGLNGGGDDKSARRFTVPRETYARDWSPVPASSFTPTGAMMDGDNSGGQMDVKYGHVLELSWALLSASRTAERAGIAAAAAADAAAEEGDDNERAAQKTVVSGFYPPSLPLSRLKSAYEYAWTFGLRDGGVVPGAGGLWRGVKNFDASTSSSSSSSSSTSSGAAVDKVKGEWWAEFEGMVAALHEWELTGNRVARDRFTRQLSLIYGYFADWSSGGEGDSEEDSHSRAGGDGEGGAPRGRGGGVRTVITEEQRRGEEPPPAVKKKNGGEDTTKTSARKDAFHTLRGVLEVKHVLAHGVTRVRLGQ